MFIGLSLYSITKRGRFPLTLGSRRVTILSPSAFSLELHKLEPLEPGHVCLRSQGSSTRSSWCAQNTAFLSPGERPFPPRRVLGPHAGGAVPVTGRGVGPHPLHPQEADRAARRQPGRRRRP